MTPSAVGSGRPARIGLVSAWASRLGGGVFEAVVAHTELVRAAGHVPVVIALEDRHSAADRARFAEAEVVTCPIAGPAMVGYAPGMAAALDAARLDLVHLHGIWMFPSRAASDWAARTGRPYLVSPHGMLDPWIVARGRLKKAVARIGYERRSWRLAARLHALTAKEAYDIRAATGRSEVVVIANAVAPAGRAEDVGGPPYALYIGRIHPKKNLDALVDAWRAVPALPAGAELRIAGWGDRADVAALEARIGDGTAGVRFLGPVYGANKAALLAAARFLVLPSHSEGLPVAILEAWAAGTPTLMSRHCNLPEGFAAGAAIDSGTNVAAIAATLARAMTLPEPEWRAMSAAASALAAARYSPATIAGLWSREYAALLAGAGRQAA